MDCDRALDLLSARLDGEDGEAGDEERLDEHLGSCASCRTAQDRMTALHRQLRLRPAEPVADRTTTLLSAIELPWARAVRQRKRRAGIGVGLAASLLLVAAVSGVLWFRSRPPAGPHLHVTDVAASATSEGGTSTVTFTIINHGRGADALVAVEVDPTIATRADLHVVRPFATIANGHSASTTAMRSVDELSISPGGRKRFSVLGSHVMLIGVSRALETGDTVTLTFSFEHSAPLRLTVPITNGPAA